MINAETSTLVFKDQAGEYYLLPQETLERGRVPAERKAEVERLISEQHEDVRGHAMGLAYAGAFLLGVMIGNSVTNYLLSPTDAPAPAMPPGEYQTGTPRSSSTVRDTSYGGR